MKISQKAFDFIKDFEGIDQPGEWPGGESGITIGYGYDLGYEQTYEADWKNHLPRGEFETLKRALRARGGNARRMAHEFAHITIPAAAAETVFKERTVPKYEAQTASAFPRSTELNPDTFGALVSLVFNRGSLVDASDRRREMRLIHSALVNSDNIQSPELYNFIADQVEKMCRLWPNVRGLRRRRIAEADMIRNSLKAA